MSNSIAEAVIVACGTDLIIVVPITSEGAPVDLRGADMKALVKTSNDLLDKDAVAEFEVSEGDATGIVTLRLPVAEVAKLSFPAAYEWDLHITLPSGYPDYPGWSDVPTGGLIETVYSITRSAS